MRILLVEDDQRICADLAQAIKDEGYFVDCCGNGEEAWFKGDTENYTAVILDLGLPGMDGLAVLRRWREGGNDFPVLVLSARGSWSERVLGIDAGADDYLPKPFQVEEVLARVRALVRRSVGNASNVQRLGQLQIDRAAKQIMRDGELLKLGKQEFRCLDYLLLHHDRVVSRSELGEHLYGDEEASENAIEVLIARLRKRVGGGVIETRRGFGYQVVDSQI